MGTSVFGPVRGPNAQLHRPHENTARDRHNHTKRTADGHVRKERQSGRILCSPAPAAQRVAADERQRSVGGDPIAGAQLADQIRRVWRRRSLPGAAQLITARSYRPTAGVQRAQRQALPASRKVQRMWSGAIGGLPRPSARRQQRVEDRAHRAAAITVPALAKQRLVARHAIAKPLASGVSEGTGTIRVDPIPVGKLVQVNIRHAPHRLADLIRHRPQPILEAVVFAHAHTLAGDVPRLSEQPNSGMPPNLGRDDRPPRRSSRQVPLVRCRGSIRTTRLRRIDRTLRWRCGETVFAPCF